MAQNTFYIVISLVSFFATNAFAELHLAQTQNGPVQGIVKEARGGAKFVAFLGLRYANPAVRFQPPEPIQEKWETPKVADTFGSICPQANVGDIDCLFLQIYVPEKHFKNGDGSSKLPVMVFIHGGGFVFGDGNSYGPEYFMENEDVILVTVNYRLGIFGFLSTGDDTIKANIGLKDQIMALRFVKENAAAFNGDDSNIIIFGESAGSSSVHYLLMTPAAEGYFDKAILQSGVMSFWAFDPNPPRQTALKFVKESLHCENVKDDAKPKEQSLQIKECLEKAETAQLAMNQLTFWPRWPRANPCSRFMPTADWEGGKSNDSFFASRPHFSQSGKKNVYYSKVPVIIGTTSDEGATAFGASAYESEESLQELTNEWNKIAPITFSYDIHFPVENLAEISQKIKKFYFGSEPITLENKQALADLYSDTWFLLPSISVAGELARNGVSVYPYIFSYWGSWTARSIFTQRTDDVYEGLAGHADDIQYLFPGSMLSSHLKPGSEQEEFSRNFVNLWTSFAKQGKPTVKWSNGKTVEWKPISSSQQETLNFDFLKIEKDPSIIKLDLKKRIDFWRNLLRDYSQEENEETIVPKTEL